MDHLVGNIYMDYARGLTEHSTLPWNSVYNCPCTNDFTRPGTQSFVGSNYNGFSEDICLGDKLWDGKQCAREGECCSAQVDFHLGSVWSCQALQKTILRCVFVEMKAH